LATESAVKGAATGRRVVHLATHGFFLKSPCEAGPAHTRAVGALATRSGRAEFADNPLLLSGLAFAGANRRNSTQAGQDDGILTAEEVAGLNLQGTEWAVLSACDTGIGEIKGGEGVFGLRRAFQIAGARTVIMSLWSVEDRSTRLWMRALYEGRFQQRLSTAEATLAASRRVLQDRRARGQSTHPFYWGAFVAAGAWR
jgi:CHAT domain-containing protein